ncbi:hypothetical protein D3C86_1004260 [compost metagenome]
MQHRQVNRLMEEEPCVHIVRPEPCVEQGLQMPDEGRGGMYRPYPRHGSAIVHAQVVERVVQGAGRHTVRLWAGKQEGPGFREVIQSGIAIQRKTGYPFQGVR